MRKARNSPRRRCGRYGDESGSCWRSVGQGEANTLRPLHEALMPPALYRDRECALVASGGRPQCDWIKRKPSAIRGGCAMTRIRDTSPDRGWVSPLGRVFAARSNRNEAPGNQVTCGTRGGGEYDLALAPGVVAVAARSPLRLRSGPAPAARPTSSRTRSPPRWRPWRRTRSPSRPVLRPGRRRCARRARNRGERVPSRPQCRRG